jgi:hypothetical protein
LTTYTGKLLPYPHQSEALERLHGMRMFALYMFMRTGKTKVVLDNFGQLEEADQIDDMLVIAPNGVYHTWETAIADHVEDQLLERLTIFTWDSGSSNTKRAIAAKKNFLEMNSGSPRIALMNVEALSSVERARDFCRQFLRDRSRAMIVIDECFIGDTKIKTLRGHIPIKDVILGEPVFSSQGISRVSKILKKRSNVLVKLTLSNGTQIRVTPNHPFFTDIGWVCAGNLQGRVLFDDEALSILRQNDTQTKILRHILLSEMANGNKSGAHLYQGQIRQDEKDQAAQWPSAPQTAKAIVEGIRPAMGTGIRHRIGREAVRLSNQLQDGLRQSKNETGNRVRWWQSQKPVCQGKRSKEDKPRSQIRVENVTIEKFTSAVDVFDLELEGTPHFFAEGILTHNSTIIKNRKAARTKFINRVLAPRASYRRILSGLPTPRSPLDLWSQFEFLDPAILRCANYWIFQARYAIVRRVHYSRWVDEIVGYQNLDQLQKLIEPYSFRVQFRPKIPSTFTIREVALTSEQKRIYTEMKRFATAKLEEASHVTATVVIAQILRLHQILCGHTLDESGKLHEIPEARTSELLEILADYSGKAVIWCSYDYSVRKVTAAIAKEYGSASVARFWGGNANTREKEELDFRTNPECRFMVATPAAGGRGRTWLEADLVIYFSSTNDLEHRDQSEQRVQGLTKERQVDYIDLIAPSTMEPKILEALRKKIDLAAVLTGDEWRNWVV